MTAAGVILIARSTGRLLLLERSSDVAEPGTWSVPAGDVESGEQPVDAALRELREETGRSGQLALLDLVAVDRMGSSDFHYVFASVPREFRPRLNWESSQAAWSALDHLPRPLHSRFERFLRYHGDAVLGAIVELRR